MHNLPSPSFLQVVHHFSSKKMFSNDLVLPIDSPVEFNNEVGTNKKKRQRKTKELCSTNEEEPKNKKILHRDIERQRRQEMALLYSSLRALLPLDCVKGKRSISDHMNEAVRYIKQTENNINELKNRRNKLKKWADPDESSNPISKRIYLTVNSCMDSRVEILINCGLFMEDDHVFPLSKVLVLVQESELTVLSWIATKTAAANDRVIYTIQSQAADLAYIDIPELEQRLVNMINMCTSFWVIDQYLH